MATHWDVIVVGAGKASAAEVNDFAAYVAKRGMPKVALSFQQYALRLDPEDKCACRVAMLANLRRTVTWAIKRPHTVNGRCSQCGGLSDEPGWTGVE